MGITEVKAAEIPDSDAETNLALQIGIKKQPGCNDRPHQSKDLGGIL
jgi:hypothetical protein